MTLLSPRSQVPERGDGSRADDRPRPHDRAAEHAHEPGSLVHELLEEAWDAMAILEPDGRVRYLSPSNERLLGYDTADLIGRDGFALVHPDDQSRVEDALADVCRTPDRAVTVTHQFQDARGRWRTLETTFQNKLSHPAIRGIVLHSRDVTDRIALHAELWRVRQSLHRTQLHPHFIFNVLNTIRMQLLVDQDAAAETLVHFGELLRLSYAHVDAVTVPLSDEITFIERYVDLYRIRFEGRIEARFDVAPEAGAVPVPSLLLQPIVENALRHGLLPANGGRLEVTARRVGDRLKITVVDDGVGYAGGEEEAGIGLSATRARLHQRFGFGADLHLTPNDERGTVVIIELPVEARER